MVVCRFAHLLEVITQLRPKYSLRIPYVWIKAAISSLRPFIIHHARLREKSANGYPLAAVATPQKCLCYLLFSLIGLLSANPKARDLSFNIWICCLVCENCEEQANLRRVVLDIMSIVSGFILIRTTVSNVSQSDPWSHKG